MGCPSSEDDGGELIVAYVARTLARETESELERHLEECRTCRELAAAQRSVWSALDVWPPVQVSSNFDQKLFRRIAAEAERTWRPQLAPASWSWRPAMPAAVACAALFAAFLLKSPLLHPVAQLQNEPKLQIEQVEHALDDMEMLRQLGVEPM